MRLRSALVYANAWYALLTDTKTPSLIFKLEMEKYIHVYPQAARVDEVTTSHKQLISPRFTYEVSRGTKGKSAMNKGGVIELCLSRNEDFRSYDDANCIPLVVSQR